jgi:CRISPR/Cas system-associated exonuclease Cas4 (RecB family)
MGLWVANNVEFYWPEYNIKGELDVLIREPGDPNIIIPLEIKSCYGYNASKEIMGNKSQQGRPKTSQMLQAATYLYYFRDQIPYVKMIYYARDSADRTEFDLTLVNEGENKTRIAVNGAVDSRFYIENILSRYKQLAQYVQIQQTPPADYEYEYSEEKIEKLYSVGEIGKTKYEAWKKGKEHPGSWQCRYCGFCHICWGEGK